MSELLQEADFSQVDRPFKAKAFKQTSKKYKNGKALLAEEKKRLDSMENIPMDKATIFSVRAPPTIKPTKKYCDITGLPAKYKTASGAHGLRYYNKEVYGVVNSLPQGVDQQYLQLRGANVQLK